MNAYGVGLWTAQMMVRTAIRVLTALALDDGLIASDPAASIKRPKIQGEIRAWTEDEIATYEQHYPIGTPARLALAVALYTGQRARIWFT